MNFHLKTLKLIHQFKDANGYGPNELFLGVKEEFLLSEYIKAHGEILNNIEISPSLSRFRRKVEFLGLKVRFEDINSMFELKHNPYY